MIFTSSYRNIPKDTFKDKEGYHNVSTKNTKLFNLLHVVYPSTIALPILGFLDPKSDINK